MSIAIESNAATDRWTPLSGVGWAGFQHAKALVGDGPVRITYVDGDLLLMSPGVLQEGYEDALRDVVKAVTRGLMIEARTIGSALWERVGMDAGKMPDVAFYLANAPRVEGREIDVDTDPVPDLVIEVEVGHPPQLALRAYARIGVPEVWHFRHRPPGPATLRFLRLDEGRWTEVETSPNLPMLERERVLAIVMQAAVLGELQRARLLDRWVRDELRPRRRPRRRKGDQA
ncbi:MAG TPA: Uma2 family endonuclease [Isosphaeraceae bacterium]|jgi:Uma2 family endonuclease|nr:Uma2 family endonuclease [Isosphaeraceae bacterium]